MNGPPRPDAGTTAGCAKLCGYPEADSSGNLRITETTGWELPPEVGELAGPSEDGEAESP